MHPEPVTSQVGQMPGHLSFMEVKRCAAAKRKKINIYTSQLPKASSSVHETYTFVSRKQGFTAHGSHVTMKPSTSSIQFAKAMNSSMTDSHMNHDFSDFTGADIDTKCLETEDDHKCKRIAGDHPLLSWKAKCDTFLLELLQHDGQGNYMNICVCENCHFGLPEYQCIDCFTGELFCSVCIVALHTRNPLHRIQKWTGSSFAALSLKQLGLQVQLGHPIGEECLLPQQAFNDDFTLIHTNGIHEIGLDYCGCGTAQTHTMQLLCAAWFPATMSEPRTAATFQILEQYHLLSFESKASGYKFYHAIARLTDNTGLYPHKDRYEAFLWMVQEWCHLKMLKCAGCRHDPTGVEGRREGECAVVCPACPQPGKNLPDDWQDAPDDKRWLYAFFVAIDANFRLKRRAISKEGTDPGLSCGWAYFVEETAYKFHLQYTCSSHNTVNMANTKASQGLATTGVGTIDCARHNMKLLNGVGDLQKGERYTNMDYLFFSTLSQQCIDVLNILYNIACQWHKHLWQRMSTMPAHLQLDHASKLVRFFIPKFHLPTHILKCQSTFSFNFSKNVGWWSNINPVALSTKEMGPGSRRDMLDDHFGDWNWKKLVGLNTCATLLRKMNEANEEHKAHTNAFEELNRALKPETTTGWRAYVKHWEENPNDASVPNPLETNLHVFIATGIDLESEQQKTVFVWQQDALQRKVDAWKRVQLLYTPIAQFMADNPEEIKLFLPSSLTADSISCSPYLLTMEWELQITQARDALDEIRQKARAAAAADKYCVAHTALSSLAPILNKVGWNFKLRLLNKKDDVHGMSVPRKGESEGRRQLSWIWMVEGVGDDEDEKEEVELLQEEMRCVLQFLRWHALWWDNIAHFCTLSGAEKEGAQIRHNLGSKFEASWVQHLTVITCKVSSDPLVLALPDLCIPELRAPL
ncbi:uncharacterized protein EDB93DRAFT_1242948 [Suillus bovinus]|uniref:uncharacterized protein n=1 Tax=Suillus bovinus TaxID=48563 RepID=UPI001B87856F|nr:uncharacterized protein EDB93DRAFT_1242948 [Suillus bovinus]KAG2132730.1 hypothetical protein EDB93DRAFT_1242948 [Suillus bovinus]